MRTPERSGAAARSAFIVLLLTVGSCTGMQKTTGPVHFRGDVDVFLEPNEPQSGCSVTIGLRNLSGVRQGEALLKLAWFDSTGSLVADQSLRMDPTDVGRYDAKNLSLPVACKLVGHVRIKSAKWSLGWDSREKTMVTIEGVDGTEWRMRWDGQTGLFAGVPAHD